MNPQGNTPNRFIWESAGSPINVSTSILNPPKGALVIDYVNAEIYFKTSNYGDNSGYVGILGLINGAIGAATNAGILAQQAIDALPGKMNATGNNAALPTSDPVILGDLWSDTNTVKTSAGS